MTNDAEDGGTTPDAPLRKGERTRRQLLEVAASLLAERGYAATTYDDLVTASGLSRGGFYFHFKTKEDLAMAVVDEKQRRWERELRSRLEPIDSPGERLAAVGPTLLAMHVEDPSGWNLVMTASELSRVPGLAPRMAAVSQRWIDYVAGIVAAAQAEGTVRGDLDPVSVATVMIASMAGLRQITSSAGSADPGAAFVSHAATLARMLRCGLRTRPTSSGTDPQH